MLERNKLNIHYNKSILTDSARGVILSLGIGMRKISKKELVRVIFPADPADLQSPEVYIGNANYRRKLKESNPQGNKIRYVCFSWSPFTEQRRYEDLVNKIEQVTRNLKNPRWKKLDKKPRTEQAGTFIYNTVYFQLKGTY